MRLTVIKKAITKLHSLHLNSYACALDDVETLLHNQGVAV